MHVESPKSKKEINKILQYEIVRSDNNLRLVGFTFGRNIDGLTNVDSHSSHSHFEYL